MWNYWCRCKVAIHGCTKGHLTGTYQLNTADSEHGSNSIWEYWEVFMCAIGYKRQLNWAKLTLLQTFGSKERTMQITFFACALSCECRLSFSCTEVFPSNHSVHDATYLHKLHRYLHCGVLRLHVVLRHWNSRTKWKPPSRGNHKPINLTPQTSPYTNTLTSTDRP